MKNVLVIGAGAVGAHIVQQGIAKSLSCHFYLFDLNESLTVAQTADMKDTLLFSKNTKLSYLTDYSDIDSEIDIVVITAGVNQSPGETRMDLLQRNASIVKGIARELTNIKDSTVVLMVTNPVDVLTQVAREAFDLPAKQVFGSGTVLDSARLRWRIASKLNRNIQNIHGYVMGEHGDSQFVSWSNVTHSESFSDDERLDIEGQVKGAAYDIIEGKGSTYFGIGAAVVHVLDALVNDLRTVMPISTNYPHFLDEELCSIPVGVPSIVGEEGVIETLALKLEEGELQSFERSAANLLQAWKSLQLS